MDITIADVAASYVQGHRAERQTLCLASNQTVALTIIQNQWAQANGKPELDIQEAPAQVMRALETSKKGHELFDRIKDEGVIIYGLKKKVER